MRQQQRSTAGFTLVEMLVSLSLFTVVLTMSVGTLLILINANGRAQSMQLVMTNFTFALDSMTREVRTGFNWYCMDAGASPPSIPEREELQGCGSNPGEALSIVESGSSLTDALSCIGPPDSCSHRVTYWFDPDAYGSDHGAIMRRLGTASEGGEWVALTGPEIWVDEVRMYVTGVPRYQTSGNIVQPIATIYIKGRAGVEGTGSNSVREREFDIETTVTQRLLDI